MNTPADASSTNPAIRRSAIRRIVSLSVLTSLVGGGAIWFLLPRWSERDYRPIERVSASDHAPPARYRHAGDGSEPDIDVIVTWNYGGQDSGKVSFLLEKVSARESNGKRRGGGGSVNWDNEAGGGGYSVSLDPGSAIWTCEIDSYWIQNKKQGQFMKKFPVTPFKTTTVEDGDLHVTIEYRELKKKGGHQWYLRRPPAEGNDQVQATK